MLVGLAVAVGGLHVEARPLMARVFRRFRTYVESFKGEFEQFKENEKQKREQWAEERERQKQRARAHSDKRDPSPTVVSATRTPTSVLVMQPVEESTMARSTKTPQIDGRRAVLALITLAQEPNANDIGAFHVLGKALDYRLNTDAGETFVEGFKRFDLAELIRSAKSASKESLDKIKALGAANSHRLRGQLYDNTKSTLADTIALARTGAVHQVSVNAYERNPEARQPKPGTVSDTGADANDILEGAATANRGLQLRVHEPQPKGHTGWLQGPFDVLVAGGEYTDYLTPFLSKTVTAREIISDIAPQLNRRTLQIFNCNLLKLAPLLLPGEMPEKTTLTEGRQSDHVDAEGVRHVEDTGVGGKRLTGQHGQRLSGMAIESATGDLAYSITGSRRQGVGGMHCLEATVITRVTDAGLNGSRDVELTLRVLGAPDVLVEFCDTRRGARLDGGSIQAAVGETFELFFRLAGVSDAPVFVEICGANSGWDVIPCVLDEPFAVNPAPRNATSAAVPAQSLARVPEWLLKFPEGGFRQVFEHLEAHGVVTESEATKMLGSPRELRSFARQFEQLVALCPFGVRIETVAGMKRFVREGTL